MPRYMQEDGSASAAGAAVVPPWLVVNLSSLPAADPGADRLLAVHSDVTNPLAVQLVQCVLPTDLLLCTRLLAALGFYKQAASSSQGLIYPASSLT